MMNVGFGQVVRVKKERTTVFSLTMLFVLLILSTSALGDLPFTCTVKPSCDQSTGEKVVLKLSNTTNAHAALPTETYPYSLCCKGIGGNWILGLDCSSKFSYNFLNLSNVTNAHVETSLYDNYHVKACIAGVGLVNCTYALDSCPKDYYCVVAISNWTNAHVEECNAGNYRIKVCCRIFSHFIWKPPEEGDIRKLIGISGTKDFLNVFWKISSVGGKNQRPLNVTCWLNGDKANACHGFRRISSCTIFHPKYNSTLECTASGCKVGKSMITCIVNDTVYPMVSNQTSLEFRHIDHRIKCLPGLNATVGRLDIRLTLKNTGLLRDRYNVTLDSLTPNILTPIQKRLQTNLLAYGEIEDKTVKILLLSSGEGWLIITTNSTEDPRMGNVVRMKIFTGYKSLSGLNYVAITQLFLLSSLIFLLFQRRGIIKL